MKSSYTSVCSYLFVASLMSTESLTSYESQVIKNGAKLKQMVTYSYILSLVITKNNGWLWTRWWFLWIGALFSVLLLPFSSPCSLLHHMLGGWKVNWLLLCQRYLLLTLLAFSCWTHLFYCAVEPHNCIVQLSRLLNKVQKQAFLAKTKGKNCCNLE